MKSVATIALMALLLCVPRAWSSTIHVDDDGPYDPGPGDPAVSDPDEDGSPEHPFDAIQEAINAALDGDEVVVADGTYAGMGNRDLDFDGRAITVHSASGDPATCIINCKSAGRGFYFGNDEGPTSVVAGFTITNGSASDGGGIWCNGASPMISNCIITENFANSEGGGICCSYSDATISHCAISWNTSDWTAGGVYFRYGEPTISDCTIAQNTCYWWGAGILCEESNPSINNCIIVRNTSGCG